MIRSTSLEAYNTIRANGSLGRMMWTAYDIVYRHGPKTVNEIMQIAKKENPEMTHQSMETIHKRLSDLTRMGLLRECGTMKCPITGFTVVIREVTNEDTPSKPDKIPLKKQIEQLKQQVIQLENEINHLRIKNQALADLFTFENL